MPVVAVASAWPAFWMLPDTPRTNCVGCSAYGDGWCNGGEVGRGARPLPPLCGCCVLEQRTRQVYCIKLYPGIAPSRTGGGGCA